MCVWILLIKYTNNKFLKAKWTPDIHCFLSWSISFKILSNSSLVLCGKGQEICITALTNPSISFYNPCNFDKFMKSIFQLWQIHWLLLADLTANVHFHSLCFVAVRIFHNKDNLPMKWSAATRVHVISTTLLDCLGKRTPLPRTTLGAEFWIAARFCQKKDDPPTPPHKMISSPSHIFTCQGHISQVSTRQGNDQTCVR